METRSAAGPDDGAVVGPHGFRVTYAGTGRARRVLERDRHGTVLAELQWSDRDVLLAARVRIPDGSWIAIEPEATNDPRWGLSDRLSHHGTPLTVFAAVDYANIRTIPPLAEPARLPPGAGTAVLNLIAALAADQGAGVLGYDGPYPTESLFLALLESFRYEGAPTDPLGAFMAGDLTWRPAPHTRLFTGGAIVVQLRDGIEKVVWRGRTYHRPRWQQVLRRTPRRVRDAAGGVVCSLWILDRAVEDHLRLAPNGDVLEVIAGLAPMPAVNPIDSAIATGVVAIVAAGGAPALRPFIRKAGRPLRLAWGPVPGDLLRVEGDRVHLSNRIPPVAAERLDAAATGPERAGAALAVLTELASVLGDVLRARAQAALLACAAPTQTAALTVEATDESTDARAIAAAVEALLVPGGLAPIRTPRA